MQVLFVEDEVQKRNKSITLRQSWLETHCAPGSYVHVVGRFTTAGQITIDDAENLIIVHPDHLISATVVADSFECIRRAVLQDRVKATSRSSEPKGARWIITGRWREPSGATNSRSKRSGNW